MDDTGDDERVRTTLDALCTSCWNEWSGDKAHVQSVAHAHLSPIVVAVNVTSPSGIASRWVNIDVPVPVDVWPLDWTA